MIGVSPDWWKDFFGPVYLVTDARSVEDPQLTRREVNLLEEELCLRRDERILDLCGGHGRHVLELARRGYKYLAVLDYSRFLLDVGRQRALSEGVNIEFRCADARETGLKDESYDAVILMGNSFGYFPQHRENFSILQEANRLLKYGGRFLLDVTDKEFCLENFKPFSIHQATGDIIIKRQRQLQGSLVCVREVVISKQKGLIQDRTYCERLYDKGKLRRLLKRAGFKHIQLRDKLSFHARRGDYGFMTSRLIAIAHKGLTA